MEPNLIDESPHGEMILAVQRAALAAVDPAAAIRRHVQRQGDLLTIAGRTYNLAAYERIWIIGGGKAATAMAAALYAILGNRLAGGVLVTKVGHTGAGDTGPVQVMAFLRTLLEYK